MPTDPETSKTALELVLDKLMYVLGGGGVASLFWWKAKRDAAKIKKDEAVELKELDQYENLHERLWTRVEQVETQIKEVIAEKNAWMQKAVNAELRLSELKLDMERLRLMHDALKSHVCFKQDCPSRQKSKE